MIVFSIIAFDKMTPFPSIYALLPTMGTGLIILCAVPKTFVHKLLSLKVFVGIGLISYSAYLWHQPILAFARHRLLGEVSELLLIALCIASLVLAWFSWKFIEAPFRKKDIFTRNKVFIFSTFGIGMFSLLGVSIHLKNGYSDRVSFTEELSNSFKRPSVENCFDIPYNHSADQWGCVLGRDKGDINFILFGDSHSASLKIIVDERAKKLGVKVFYTGSSGCPPLIGVYPKRSDQYKNDCNLLNNRVFKLARANNIEGIILSAKWSYYTFGNYDSGGSQLISDKPNGPFTLQHSLETFHNLFDVTVDRYNSIKVPIHVITQPPLQKHVAESLYFSNARGIGSLRSMSIDRSDFDTLNEIPMRVFFKRKDDINIHDITDLFCDKIVCPIGEQARSFYYDNNHLSSFGAMKLGEVIDNIFSKEGTVIAN